MDELSIYTCITANGKRSEINLKRNILFNEWNFLKNSDRETSLYKKARGLKTFSHNYLNLYLGS